MSTLISKEPVCFHIDFRHRNVYLDFLNIKYTGTDQILELIAQLCKVKWTEVYFITLSKTILLKVPFENWKKNTSVNTFLLLILSSVEIFAVAVFSLNADDVFHVSCLKAVQ